MNDERASSRLRYGRDQSHFVDIWQPSEACAARAVAVLLHGGWWRDRFDLSLMNPLCARLARDGWIACNVEYRRVGSGGGWPQSLDDVQAALDAVEQELQPPARPVAIGHSAGGQLALLATMRHDLAGVVALAAATDPVECYRLQLGERAAEDFFSATPEEAPDRYRRGSPCAALPLGTRQLLVHGTRDDRVPIAMTRTYGAKAAMAGDDVKVLELEGDHFTVIDPAQPFWADILDWIRPRTRPDARVEHING